MVRLNEAEDAASILNDLAAKQSEAVDDSGEWDTDPENADPTELMVTIRPETPSGCEAIREVHVRAFGEKDGEPVARLAELLRNRGKAPIALVAVIGEHIVGHIMFSEIAVEQAPEGFHGIGLAPVSVLPEFQNRRIGAKLIAAGLEECKRAAYDAVVVLGHATYYSRFGFLRALDYDLENEYNALDAFMVMELRPGVLKGIKGLVKYSPEFRESGC